ncbi:hypothetical protein Zmor_006055 [Zophobas morio]|uniref:CCHC-type domain-containing protein n=1 Tax=Zophobas morio TaxID=2755281 RepID=A0AA38IU36_9CUCU|nr:hypothetical protein Zmor_006055 [Zophobas morio]
MPTVGRWLELGRSIEEVHLRAASFCPPPSKQLLEPEMAYAGNKSTARSSVAALSHTSHTPNQQSHNSPDASLRCWKCRLVGHRAKNCQNLPGLVCYKCQKPNVTSRNCTNCNPPLSAMPHLLIFGVDFWKEMGIVPNLSSGSWYFSTNAGDVERIEAVRYAATLSPEQVGLLDLLIKVHKETIGELLGSTTKCEHVIEVTGPPIKQRYYRVSPVMQQHINQELDDMLRKGIVEKSNSPGPHRYC